jgi:pectin methylesterase-like acyl-CoA thioesterase
VIYVKEGVYEEYVTITRQMPNVTMTGDGSKKTIITGKKNFIDGITTFKTATVCKKTPAVFQSTRSTPSCSSHAVIIN